MLHVINFILYLYIKIYIIKVFYMHFLLDVTVQRKYISNIFFK